MRSGALAGALVGAAFFYWIAGPRVIDPGEFEWLMKLDWRINFLGWHLFRNDPWNVPPGAIDGYLAGEGTTIGLTDSIPLAALLLKPFDPWLPTPFQYFGIWLMLCFALQGAFGAMLARVYTRQPGLQIAAAALFVLVPTLLMRVGHAALTAHFVLLWALLIYVRSDRAHPPSWPSYIGLAVVVGLIHPYLAAMTLAMLAAIPLRDRTWRAWRSFMLACVATVVAWWMAGFIAVADATDLSAGGLGLYSMNLLSPVTPRGWSAMLPEWPVTSELQAYEGFQYLGVGVLLLLTAAFGILAVTWRAVRWSWIAPLLVVCTLCACYALSPRVTFGSTVVVDWTSPALDRLAMFRASGRFFWPMTYLALTAAIALVVSRLRAAVAAVVLVAAVVVQFADLQPAHAERRLTSRSDAFHTWPRVLTSARWHDVLPLYDHVLLVPPSQCGGAPIEHEELAYLAGLHGLTINSGLAARWNERARRTYCDAIDAAITRGDVAADAIYVVTAAAEQRLRAASPQVACETIDTARVCVTAASRAAWPR